MKLLTPIMVLLAGMATACLITPEDAGTTTAISGFSSGTESESSTGAPNTGILTTTDEPTDTDTSGTGSSTGTGTGTGDTGPKATEHVVFVTSESVLPNFGGAAAAAVICQSAAEGANLAGTFVPWVSDSAFTPADVFNMASTTPLVFPSGTQAFPGGFAGMPAKAARAEVMENEFGVLVEGEGLTWTNVALDGSRYSEADCNNWTYVGDPDAPQPMNPDTSTLGVAGWAMAAPQTTIDGPESAWTLYLQLPCNYRGRLLCIQLPE